jgi:aldehyde dehydrogenase (NAD+)
MAIAEAETEVLEFKKEFEGKKRALPGLRAENPESRLERLKILRRWIHANRALIHKAMFDDFSKPSAEVDAIELFHVLNEIQQAIDNLATWAAPKKIDAPLTMLGTRSFIQYEPRGVCLIISPWNYPFSLAVGPLVSALAAGNAVILKPSEHTPNVSALLAKMAGEIFDKNIVSVIEGDAETSKALLRLPFDHIFFTGSPSIGKEVMKAAAEHLSSVTLELGGKSPTIVTASAKLSDACERIAVSKFVNNGQTCVAPDYILVDEKIADDFIRQLIEKIKKFFSEKTSFQNSPSYCRIVNDKHFARLNDLLQDAVSQGAKIEFGGVDDQASRFFHPRVLSQISADSRIMDEEIFGPILPVLSYKHLDQAIDLINSKPKPLALYIYSGKGKEKKKFLRETSSGGVCINDSGIHFLHHNLPFGGINNSGMGKSHGHYGFLAFSHEKAVLQQKSGFIPIKLFYPPYTRNSSIIMDWFLKFFK